MLEYDHIVDILSSSSYSQIPTNIGMWKHDTKKAKLCPCVDNFEIKYFSDENAHHLLTSLQKYYAVSVDMKVKHFYGFKFDWYSDTVYINIKITNYVSNVLYCFQHTPSSQPKYSPHAHKKIRNGEKHQYSKASDLSKHINKK